MQDMTLQALKQLFEVTPESDWQSLMDQLRSDKRTSVIKLIASKERLLLNRQKKQEHLLGLHAFDLDRMTGFSALAGIDEAGRGPLAGPVVAAVCMIGYSDALMGLDDSKKIPEAERDSLFDVIQSEAITYGIGIVDHDVIDDINILEATKRAMHMALSHLKPQPDVVITDHVKLMVDGVKVFPEVKGDQKSLAVAAASILAKVTRDRIMVQMDAKYPQYGFSKHKGYGTQAHYDALRQHGPSPIHRMSFLKNMEW